MKKGRRRKKKYLLKREDFPKLSDAKFEVLDKKQKRKLNRLAEQLLELAMDPVDGPRMQAFIDLSRRIEKNQKRSSRGSISPEARLTGQRRAKRVKER